MKKFFFFLVILAVASQLYAQLKTYDYPFEARRSQFYRTVVSQGDNVQESFVHISECPDGPFADHKIWVTEQDRSVSFTNFDFAGEPVKVTVTKLYGTPAYDVVITPSRYGILIEKFDGYSVTFILDKPEYVSVRFVCDDNTDEFNNIKNAMMVFADGPETDAPKIGEAGVEVFKKGSDLINARVIYFAPGVYNLFDYIPNGNLILRDDQSIYIAGGAYVYGVVTASAAFNTKLYGRGVLSGFKHGFHYDGQQKQAEFGSYNYRINMARGSNHTIEGVALLESVNHTMDITENTLVKDVKFISWACNNDGVYPTNNSVIDHVFMKVCDDYFYATTKALITRCVIWPMFNGGTLQLGWGNREFGGGTRFINNDIINPEWDWIGANTGFINSQIKPDAKISDIVIEDLHIDGDVNALAALDFALVPGRKYDYTGSIKNISFKNIELNGKQIWWGSRGWDGYERLETQLSRDYNINPQYPAVLGKSFIRGISDGNGKTSFIENITFENVRINGEWVTDKNYKKYFDVDPNTTKQIKFVFNPEYTFKEPALPKSVEQYAKEGIGAKLKVEKNKTADEAAWLTEGKKVKWSFNLTEANEYEVRYANMPIYETAKFKLSANGKEFATVENEAMRENSSCNIKKVLKDKLKLQTGINSFEYEQLKGTSYPDVLEIVPIGGEPGTAEYLPWMHWHGMIVRTESNWKSHNLYASVTNERLSLRFYDNEYEPGSRKKEYGNKFMVGIYNHSGELILEKRFENTPMELDITKLIPSPYTVVITDGKSFWIAKQIVKY